MVKTLGDYIREAEAQRNFENSYWYMPQCQIPISPPPHDPYLDYWDDYEPPPYSSHWNNHETLHVQRQEEEIPYTNDVFEQIKANFDYMKGQIGTMNNGFDRMSGQISSIIALLSQESQETPNSQTEQYKDNILSSDEVFSGEDNQEEEALEKDEETPTEGSQIKIIAPTEGSYIETKDANDESGCEENEKDPLVLDLEKEEKTQNSGQIVLTIGDAAIEVHRGKVTLRSGKEDDVINALISNENLSSLTSPYSDVVVETNIVSDLKMQDLSEKTLILQDPSIVVDGYKIKIPQFFEVHPPRGKRKKNVNHMVRKLRRCTALDVKFALGEPPD